LNRHSPERPHYPTCWPLVAAADRWRARWPARRGLWRHRGGSAPMPDALPARMISAARRAKSP